MSDYSEGNSTSHIASCFCHDFLGDIQDFVNIVCYYNCKLCDFSCTSVADIRSHIAESHLHRTCGLEGVTLSSESTANDGTVSNDASIIQMPSAELASTASVKEVSASEAVGLVSREFSTISQLGCDFLSSTVVTHSADLLAPQPLHSTIAGQTLQLFVNDQEIQLSMPNCFSRDSLQDVAALPAGLCVEGRCGSASVQPADLVKSVGPVAIQCGIAPTQTVECSEQTTEMYVCDSCGTVFNGSGIVEHMLQVHGIRLDSVNETRSPVVLTASNDQHVPSACTWSMDVTMPPNTMSIGTQAQLLKKPGRKRKVPVDATTSSASEELISKHVASTAEKDSAAAVAVKTLGIERLATTDGLSKRRIQPPRALVEDYHIHRLRQSKPRTRSAASAAPGLPCSFAGCQATFRQQAGVDYHLKCHTDAGLFRCPECCSSFAEWSSMLPHLWTVHSIDLFAYRCGQCKFRANHSSAVTEHTAVEHGRLQPFLCSVCGQTFRKSNLRNQHEKSHSSRRLFSHSRARSELITFRRCVCDLCKRSFANKKSLNKHIEVSVLLSFNQLLTTFVNSYLYRANVVFVTSL